MAKRKRRRRFRVTPHGYVVLSASSAVLLIILCVCLILALPKSAEGSGDAARPASQAVYAHTGVGAPATGAEAVPTVAPTPMPLPTPTPAPLRAPSGVRLPTAEEEEGAVDGILRTSGVALRKGPGKSFELLQKYDDGERLRVYAEESEYSLVQIVSDGTYGYMATEFILRFGILPGDSAATPVPTALPNAVMGLVNVTELSMRSVPSTKNNTPLGVFTRGTLLWVFYETDDFYYVEAAGSGQRCYVYAQYVMTQADVPRGTPAP